MILMLSFCQEGQLAPALLSRLALSAAKIAALAEGTRSLAAQPDVRDLGC